MSGNVKRFVKNKGFESINRDMLQDVEHLSLQAIGLLANLTSYPDTWTIYKTELYNRFAKNGRRSVENAWNELVKSNYVVQLRKREGNKYSYIYYHSQTPFTDEDIQEIEKIEGVKVWDGKVSKQKKEEKPSTVQNAQSKNCTEQNAQSESCTAHFELFNLNCSKRTANKLTREEVNYKDLDTIDTVDTEKDNLQSIRNEKLKEEYIKKAFYENSDKIPPELGKVFEVFCRSTEEAERYYKSINQAKLDVFKDALDYKGITLFELVQLENNPELLQRTINTFVRVIRKVEKERNIENPSGYLYKAVYKQIWGYYKLDSINDQSENRA